MTHPPTRRISGWGLCPSVEARETVGEDLARLTQGAVLSRGLGRSYGDASLPPPVVCASDDAIVS